MKNIIIKIKGDSALLMNSDKLANPLDPESIKHKQLTDKRTKNMDDHLAIARSEFNNSLYLHEGKIVMPTINLRASFIDGAKLNRLGASFQRGTMILMEFVPLIHSGPSDWKLLFENKAFVDCRSVVVSGRKLMRYRPRFNEWSCSVEIMFDPKAIDAADIVRSAENAGLYCGLGDFRPTKKGPFGRYSVKVVEK